MEQPLVSVITPSFQAARFIEWTIKSVLGQDYPRVEYLVMDGGSTDGTLAILEPYRDRLSWFSGPDGAAAAINSGFARTRGSIVAWINADDAYEPGAISAAVAGLAQAPDAAAVYGEGVWIDEYDGLLGQYPTAMPFDAAGLAYECFLCQPAVFMRREALQAAGGMDAHLHDYDLWIRLSRVGPFVLIPVRLARSRMHRENKTLCARKQVFQENIRVLRRHYGYVPVKWVYGYLSFLRDGRDQFFEPLRSRPLVYLASLPAG